MKKVSVIIPNYNGMQYVKRCLDSLRKQTLKEWEVLFVDNGSTDGSKELVEREYPEVKVIALPENLGFCGAVNLGIKAASAEYVVLLNNDTEAEPKFLEQLYEGIRKKKNAFSAAAMMLQFHDHRKIDDAGNYYNALGWAFARGKGKPEENYREEKKIFSSCAGAAIYRKKLVEELGYLDEEHFAYLEDMDLGYRAMIAGYENWYLPKARVYHVGSGTSGSRYNQFKIRYSSRNNIYMIYKNMPLLQIILNLPLLLAGFGIKLVFFAKKGYGKEYAAGIKNGFSISKKSKKVPFRWKNIGNYCRIQLQLWINIIRRFA
ncbi:MAG: glycosyltransferase family 2 protein [Clostridia bacterium]|nr:glycosyltransferase family 2 protein [Clostridia bacterium]NCC44155.1 glycosyltransferase family 2 protein [Clostridia bacterium]